jgi:predicted DNA-binding transcriptional regulator AlpA
MQNIKHPAARILQPLDDPIYRPRQIAEKIGKHPEVVRQHIRAGAMKSVRLGRRSIGVRASEVQRWLDAMNAGDPAAFAMPPRKGEPTNRGEPT